MKLSQKVDHKCSVPATDRHWDKLEPRLIAHNGQPMHEVWKCRSCGYEFELPRFSWKSHRRLNSRMH